MKSFFLSYNSKKSQNLFRLSPRQTLFSVLSDGGISYYELLLRRCPGIVDHLSLNAISSFLSITPQMLSKIRKGITFDGNFE